MTGNSIVSNGSLAALAISLLPATMAPAALTAATLAGTTAMVAFATPAVAQDQRGAERRGGGDRIRGSRPDSGRMDGGRQGWNRGQGATAWPGRNSGGEDRTATAPQRAPRASTPAQPGWDGNRWNPSDANRASARAWNRDAARDRTAPPATAQSENRDGQNWGERNRTYTDRDRDYRRDDNRNRDYRRDNDRRADNWRGNDWRRNDSGWRNNNTWRGDNWRNNSGYRGDYRRWDNGWHRDRRYDWRGYRSANRGIYRLPRYYAPYRGYGYSRLSIGIFINSGFYGNRYWINDPWAYRLPPAYGPYRWIRYFDDVVLVDIYSGEVVDVIENFFW